MPTAIRIVNDTIIPGPTDPYETGLTARETQTRIAFYIVAVATPSIGAILALFTTKRWWARANLWSFPRLCALWFISVGVFATFVFFQPGRATRSTFVLGIIHGMVEVCMICLLLGGSAGQSLVASMIFALIDMTLAFSLSDMGYVFIIVSVIGGLNDFLIPLLLLYGKQPLLALGGLGHTVAAVAVFTSMVYDLGVITFSLVSFFSLWAYVGFTIAGLWISRKSAEEYPNNPMKTSVPRKVLARLVVISLVAAAITTILLAYVAPKK